MTQIWIKNKHGYFAAISNGCLEKKPMLGVLYLAGFMQTKCGSFYFGRDLLRELGRNSIYGLSIDFFGHGDSYGVIEKVNRDKLCDNVLSAIEYMTSQGINKIHLIGHGFGANIGMEATKHEVGVIKHAINPLVLDDELCNDLTLLINEQKSELICLELSCLKRMQRLFYMLGCEMSNIENENLAVSFLQELVNKKMEHDVAPEMFDTIYITEDLMDKYISLPKNMIRFGNFYNHNDRIRLIKKLFADIVTEKY